MQHHRITYLITQLLRVSLLSTSLATSAIAQVPACINHAPNVVNCPANINIPSNTPPGTVLARCTAQFRVVCPKGQSIAIAKPGVREDYHYTNMLNTFVTKYPGVTMRTSNISVNRPQRGQWPTHDVRYETIMHHLNSQGFFMDAYRAIWFKGLSGSAAVDNAELQGQIEIELIRGENMKRLDKDTTYGWNNVLHKYDWDFEASQLGGLMIGTRNLLDVAFYISNGYPDVQFGTVSPYAIPYYFQTTITEAVACTVTRPVINVDMGKISMSDLNNAPGPEVPFQMGFNCPGGARVALTLTDAANPSNLTDTLTLSGSPTAQGVGIQIKNSNGGIITFAQATAAAAQVTVPLTGDASIPFTARYKKNGPITPGKGNAQMTVNVAYQ